MHRWRHRRITFSEALTPEIDDGYVYTDNAQSPNTTVVVANYSATDGFVEYDRLIGCTVNEQPDGIITATGISTWLTDEVHVPPEDAELTVYIWPNPADCTNCP